MNNVDAHRINRDKFIQYLKKNIQYLKRRNSILALKASTVKKKHDNVNICTIVVSTTLTILETVRYELELDKSPFLFVRKTSALLPVAMTAFIALSMSILKFKRYTEQLETMTKISEKIIYTVCRLRRCVEDAHNTKTKDELEAVKMNYSATSFDLYMNAREALDRNMRFQDVVYYGRLLDTWTEDMEGWRGPWYTRIFASRCCRRRRKEKEGAQPKGGAARKQQVERQQTDSPTTV